MKIDNLEYYQRIADKTVEEKLDQFGAVVIQGPKWCGKTMTALEQCNSALFMQDPDSLENNLALANEKPSILLKGERPRLIDEWQEAPILWDAVRFAVDREQLSGAYILTGSATPKEKPRHTGTGRMGFVEMRTMSLMESRESCDAVSLKSLFSDTPVVEEEKSNGDIEQIANLIVRGGWPYAVTKKHNKIASDYVVALTNYDVRDCDDVKRNPRTALEILQEYARCTSTQAGLATMSKNLKSSGAEISRPTFSDYVSALRKLHVIEDLSAWQPSLKSKARTTTTPKRYLTDPSLACAAMRMSPEMLIDDLSTMGHFFENLCIRDLSIYSTSFGASSYFFHDSTGLEVDCILTSPRGRWGMIEVKLKSTELEEGVKTLDRALNRIDTSQIGSPSFRMIITGSGYSRIRPDGIIVCPITCLGP